MMSPTPPTSPPPPSPWSKWRIYLIRLPHTLFDVFPPFFHQYLTNSKMWLRTTGLFNLVGPLLSAPAGSDLPDSIHWQAAHQRLIWIAPKQAIKDQLQDKMAKLTQTWSAKSRRMPAEVEGFFFFFFFFFFDVLVVTSFITEMVAFSFFFQYG